VGHGGHDIEGGGFAAAGFGGSEVEARGSGKGGDGIGVRDPEGENDGGAGVEVEVKEEAVMDLVKEGGGVGDGFGPGGELGQDDGIGLGVVFEAAGAFDFVIEGGEAEVEAFGFGAADVVVFDGGEAGEAAEVLFKGCSSCRLRGGGRGRTLTIGRGGGGRLD